MFVGMGAVLVMKMPVMDVIGMPRMLGGRMTAFRAMNMAVLARHLLVGQRRRDRKYRQGCRKNDSVHVAISQAYPICRPVFARRSAYSF